MLLRLDLTLAKRLPMSTSMFRTRQRKIAPPFGGFTSTAGRGFSFSLFSGTVFDVGCADDRQRIKSHGHSETVPLIFLKVLDIFQPLTMSQLLEGFSLALFALCPHRDRRRVWHVHGLRHVADQGFCIVGHSVKPAIGGFLPAGFKVCKLPVKE